MRILLYIFIIVTISYASNINNSMLRIHATLVPKIVLMDYQLQNKLRHNTISIAIVYNKGDKSSALKLKKMIYTKYQNKIKNFILDVKLFKYTNISKSYANIYYLLPSSKKNIKNCIKVASQNKALTFSYEKQNLELGTMLSLNLGSKVKPIVNLQAVKNQGLTLRPILLKISDIYTKEGTI